MSPTLPTLSVTEAVQTAPSASELAAARLDKDDQAVREKFQTVMGEMLFGQMLKSMRKTVGKPAYFHGGRAEEIFTQQLDEVLAQTLSESSADQYMGPMYDLWALGRK